MDTQTRLPDANEEGSSYQPKLLAPTLSQRIGPFGHEILLAVVLVLLMLGAHHVDPLFVTIPTQQQLLFNVWDLALLALPMTYIIVTGGIDLSVGSAMSLASVVMGMLYQLGHWPIWAAASAAVVTGILCGALNGLFVAKIKVHPLIVTLATYSAFRGLAEGLSLGFASLYNTTSVYSGFPAGFTWLGQTGLFAGNDLRHPHGYALPAAGWLFIIAALVMAILLAKAPLGRILYAIGHNETAARFSGLKVDRVKLGIYTLSGLMAGFAAINYSAHFDTAQASTGQGLELDVITAVVLGGTSIFGGRGRIIGTLLGVALIHETREFVSWHFNDSALIRLVLGSLLVVTVAINAQFGRKKRT
jgi:rhamnose transport system permease protein